mmetsp:Transcript_133182/g.265707  ORF Transcript_133182/g.265707 Transcript_133182/m.265707 type:complete len:202 (-) Transcript_133182:459-1064(-)
MRLLRAIHIDAANCTRVAIEPRIAGSFDAAHTRHTEINILVVDGHNAGIGLEPWFLFCEGRVRAADGRTPEVQVWQGLLLAEEKVSVHYRRKGLSIPSGIFEVDGLNDSTLCLIVGRGGTLKAPSSPYWDQFRFHALRPGCQTSTRECQVVFHLAERFVDGHIPSQANLAYSIHQVALYAWPMIFEIIRARDFWKFAHLGR